MTTLTPEPEERSPAKQPRRVGIVVIIVSLLALAQVLYFSYQQRQQADCQAQVNAAFLDTIKSRSSLNDARDENFETLITDVFAATTPEEGQAAFQKYEKRKQEIQKLRDSFKYPDIENTCK